MNYIKNLWIKNQARLPSFWRYQKHINQPIATIKDNSNSSYKLSGDQNAAEERI